LTNLSSKCFEIPFHFAGKWSFFADVGLSINDANSVSLNVLPLKIPQSGKASLEFKVTRPGEPEGGTLDNILREIRIEVNL